MKEIRRVIPPVESTEVSAKMKYLALLTGALFTMAIPAVTQAQVTQLDPLHGCVGTNCNDNGTNTPITTNLDLNFTASAGPLTGTMFIDILIPDNGPTPGPDTVTGHGGGATGIASLVSVTPWTSGTLEAYVSQINASPNNPLGAYLPSSQAILGNPAGLNGFFVLQVNLGTETLPSPGNPGVPNWDIGFLPLGSYVVAYLDGTSKGDVSTANSGALFMTTGAVPEPATWAMMLLGFVGLGFAFRTHRRITGLA
jgi:hypothetical protein